MTSRWPPATARKRRFCTPFNRTFIAPNLNPALRRRARATNQSITSQTLPKTSVQVTLPLLTSHLFNKGFNKEFIAHLITVVCVQSRKIARDPTLMILSASKDQLAEYLSDLNTTDDELEKLHEIIGELGAKNGKMKQIDV